MSTRNAASKTFKVWLRCLRQEFEYNMQGLIKKYHWFKGLPEQETGIAEPYVGYNLYEWDYYCHYFHKAKIRKDRWEMRNILHIRIDGWLLTNSRVYE